jgi:hypothetical protein
LSGKIRLATPQKVLKKACNWLIFKKLSTISIKTICVSPAGEARQPLRPVCALLYYYAVAIQGRV